MTKSYIVLIFKILKNFSIIFHFTNIQTIFYLPVRTCCV